MPNAPTPAPSEGRFVRSLNRLLIKLKVEEVPHIKRVIVTVVGGTVLVFGVFLIFTPGPSVLVIPVGLAILGTEYAWARRWLKQGRKMAGKALSRSQRIIGAAAASGHKWRRLGRGPAAASTPTAPGGVSRDKACEDVTAGR